MLRIDRSGGGRATLRVWLRLFALGLGVPAVLAYTMHRQYETALADAETVASSACSVVDEFTRECLAIRVSRKLKAHDVIDVFSDLFSLRGVPGHIRSDDGPAFIAQSVQAWIAGVGSKTAYSAPGSPWENGYVESFDARRRDELLHGEVFYTLREAQIIESWRRHSNTVRPHGALGYRPPAPEVSVAAFAWPAARARPAPPAKLPVEQRPTLH